ncbi:MAG: hypothetical protein ACXV2J_07540, partial [Actinomycetes bacterium]
TARPAGGPAASGGLVHEPRSCSAGNLAAKPPLTRRLRCDPRAFTLFDHHVMTRPVSFDAED